jgi:hypothetical protein
LATVSPVGRCSSVEGTLGAAVPNYTNQLLDKVEALLIENCALDTALEVVMRLMPSEAREKVRSHIDDIKSDSTLRKLVRRRFAEYRDQSLESSPSQLLEDDLAKGVMQSRATKPGPRS